MKKLLLGLCIILGSTTLTFAQKKKIERRFDLKEAESHLNYLASDKLMGRDPVRPEITLAIDYITKEFENIILQGMQESLIFAPLKNIGLIIIDEEQEASYKQENSVPRYHARDVAMVRGKHANATVLLTSATPSLESYYNALKKKFTLLKLTKRYGKSVYPSVEIVDMKQQPYKNGSQLISTSLANAINKCLIE